MRRVVLPIFLIMALAVVGTAPALAQVSEVVKQKSAEAAKDYQISGNLLAGKASMTPR